MNPVVKESEPIVVERAFSDQILKEHLENRPSLKVDSKTDIKTAPRDVSLSFISQILKEKNFNAKGLN